MSNLIRSPYIKILCCYLALFMTGIIPHPREVWASFIPYSPKEVRELDEESLKTIQTALENKMISEKLSELGLTEEEVILRVEQLNPEEREVVLEKLETIQSGGFAEPIILLIAAIIYVPIAIIVSITKAIFFPSSLKSHRSKAITFNKASDSNFSPYKGKVKVLIEEEAEGNFIYIGKIDLRTSSAISKEKRNKIFLKGFYCTLLQNISTKFKFT